MSEFWSIPTVLNITTDPYTKIIVSSYCQQVLKLASACFSADSVARRLELHRRRDDPAYLLDLSGSLGILAIPTGSPVTVWGLGLRV